MPPNNTLPMHGNDKTMNLNSLVLANIQASPYFKVHLFDLKTYHQVIDEIYYKVTHLEPWEKGSRKTAGQTGMCGGVRGVGTGGIVSSAFCLLFKLYTLKLTRKQLISVCTHPDSGYIRGLGLMYIRFTQPPQDLWEWYEPYLDDEEEVDVKAGGGHMITIGEMASQLLTKLEWYSTLFPRVPAPIQKTIEANLAAHMAARPASHRGNDRNGGGRGGRDGEEDDDRDSRAPAQSRRSPPSADRDRTRARDGHSSGMDGRRQQSPSERRRSPHRDRRPSREDDRTKRRSRSPRRDRKRSRSPVQRRRSPGERKRSPDQRRRSPEVRRRSVERKPSPSTRDGKRERRSSQERGSHKGRHSPDRSIRVCNSRYERPRERDHSPFESDLKKELERVHRDRR